MSKKSKRATNLNLAITKLEKALELARELTFNAGGLNDLSKAPALGVYTLERLGVIEVIETDDNQYWGIVRK